MISVIVPTCNRPNELAACLHRLTAEHQSFTTVQFEVIVTDDGRRQPAEQLCKSVFPWVIYNQGPAKGPAANRNSGVDLSSYDWLVFVDDDCLPDAGLLRAYFAKMCSIGNNECIALQGPTLRAADGSSLLWEAPHNPNGEFKISANFAITKFAFETVGRFDDRYPTAAIEDTEFFSRFEHSGGRVEFVPEAIVKHPLRRIGTGKSLASKWEGKVIWALDQDASPVTITWRLPWHVLRVIHSRFRNASLSIENMRAGCVFALEWLHVVAKTRAWVRKWSKKTPSKFWREHTSRFGPPPKYGF